MITPCKALRLMLAKDPESAKAYEAANVRVQALTNAWAQLKPEDQDEASSLLTEWALARAEQDEQQDKYWDT